MNPNRMSAHHGHPLNQPGVSGWLESNGVDPDSCAEDIRALLIMARSMDAGHLSDTGLEYLKFIGQALIAAANEERNLRDGWTTEAWEDGGPEIPADLKAYPYIRRQRTTGRVQYVCEPCRLDGWEETRNRLQAQGWCCSVEWGDSWWAPGDTFVLVFERVARRQRAAENARAGPFPE